MWHVAKKCSMVSCVRERVRLRVLRAGGVVAGCGQGRKEMGRHVGTLGGGAMSSSLSSSSEITGLGEGRGHAVGICVCACTLGGGAWEVIGVFGVGGNDGCFVASLKSCWRRCRSCRFLAPTCCALALCLMTCARLAAAAMRASVGDTDGLVRYLCLKNTVAAIRVLRVVGDHIFQHL